MAKKTEVINEIEEKNVNNGTIDSDIKGKEAIDTLKVQLQEHMNQVEYHKTMATKAQGALEVLLQLYPEKEVNES